MKKIIFGILTALTLPFAETVELTGKIVDQNYSPIPFVEVVLEGQNLKDTTGSDGTWSLQSEVTPVLGGETNGVEVNGNAIFLDLAKSELVSFSIFDIDGNVIFSEKPRIVRNGKQKIDLSAFSTKVVTGQYYLKIKIGSEIYSQKIPFENGFKFQTLKREVQAPSIGDKLVYKLQGQILSEDQISSYKQYVEKWLVTRNVSGKFELDTLGRTVIKEVWANFSGGKMSTPLITRLGWVKTNNSYSGKVYSVKPLGGNVYEYELWVEGRDSLGHKTTLSQRLEFDSFAGDLDLDPAMVGNALPLAEIEFVTQDASVNDSVLFKPNVSDLNESQVASWEYNWNNSGWVSAQNLVSAAVIAPSDSSLTPISNLIVRVTDLDSNIQDFSASWVGIQQDVPVGTIQGPSSGQVNSSLSYTINPVNQYGIIKTYEWTVGTSAFQLGTESFSFKPDSQGDYQVKVRVTDDDANQVTFTKEVSISGGVVLNKSPILISSISDIVLLEDFSDTIIVSDLRTVFSDPDGEILNFSIVSKSNKVNGLISANQLVLSSISNLNGTDSLIVTAKDSSNTMVSDTFVVSISSINDQPNITGHNLAFQIPSTDSAVTVSMNSYLTINSMGASNESYQLGSSSVNLASSGLLFAVNPTVDAGNNLMFSLAGSQSGKDTLRVIYQDNGGLSNGGINSDTAYVVVSVGSDGAEVKLVGASTFSIHENSDATNTNKANNSRLISIPVQLSAAATEAASLEYELRGMSAGRSWTTGKTSALIGTDTTGKDIGIGASYGASSPTGTLSFNIGSDIATTTLKIWINDDNLVETGAGGSEYVELKLHNAVKLKLESDPSAVFASLDSLIYLIPVVSDDAGNDSPTVVNPISDITLLEDFSDTLIVADLNTVFNDIDGDNLNYSVTFTNRVTSKTSSLGSDSLILQSTMNEYGVDGKVVVTANDGFFSVSDTFLVNITPVNDAPEYTSGSNIATTEGVVYSSPWASSISVGPSNENSQTLSFVIDSVSNSGLFDTQPALSNTGVLSFEGASKQTGTATVYYYLKDNGGTSNGGVDSTVTSSFTVTLSDASSSQMHDADPSVKLNNYSLFGADGIRILGRAGTVNDGWVGSNGDVDFSNWSPVTLRGSIKTRGDLNLGTGAVGQHVIARASYVIGNTTGSVITLDTTGSVTKGSVDMSVPHVYYKGANSVTNVTGTGTFQSDPSLEVDALGFTAYTALTASSENCTYNNKWTCTGATGALSVGDTLPAGDYAAVNVTAGTALFGSGVYKMTSYSSPGGTNTLVKHGNSVVRFIISESFSLGGGANQFFRSNDSTVSADTAFAGRLLVRVEGATTNAVKFIGGGTIFHGTLMAPNATIVLKSELKVYGQVFAKEIELENNFDGSNGRFVSFGGDWDFEGN